MANNLKLLAIFAHPDDEAMGMGGTLAKYSAEGVETYYVCASRGERGWFGSEEQNPGLQHLSQLRTQELTRVFWTGNFYRTFSLVNGGRKVETDLFEGLR